MMARDDTAVAVSLDDKNFLVEQAAAQDLSVKAFLARILKQYRDGA